MGDIEKYDGEEAEKRIWGIFFFFFFVMLLRISENLIVTVMNFKLFIVI